MEKTVTIESNENEKMYTVVINTFNNTYDYETYAETYDYNDATEIAEEALEELEEEYSDAYHIKQKIDYIIHS